jgi:ferrous iron transport protein B
VQAEGRGFQHGRSLDSAYSEEELSKALGLPVVYASATKRQGVEKLIKLEPPAASVVKSPILARPVFAVSALITPGVLSLIFLMAVVEGITPWGAELPASIARVLDAVGEAGARWITENISGLGVDLLQRLCEARY